MKLTLAIGAVAAAMLTTAAQAQTAPSPAIAAAMADPGRPAAGRERDAARKPAHAEIEAAGFVFEGESPVLRNPADPKTGNVFDPAIRGKTDQLVSKFRKPA